MADESATAQNRTNESPTKTIESVLLINESSLRDSPNVDDDDAKSDEIEREKTASPSLEIAEECIESFIYQGLENVNDEHEQAASTSSDTYNKDNLEISKPLSIGHNKEKSIDCNSLQENIPDTVAIHDSERHNVKEETSNIIMEAKNIINTCLLDAVNLDDRLSVNADDDVIDNSEKELTEVEKEMDFEENSENNFGKSSTMNYENDDRTCSKLKWNDSEESDIEDTEKNCTKVDNVATADDGVKEVENFDGTKDGKKDKFKKHKHHKKHSKKKKKKHKKEKKAEKQKEKDSKEAEEEGASGDENSLEDCVFETTTNFPSISSKPKDSLVSKPPQKRKLASIVTCVSSANVSTLSGKGELGNKEEPASQRYKETSKIDESKRRSSERSSKSSESFKDEVKANVSTLSGKAELSNKEDSTSKRYEETSKIGKSKRPSSEHSSKLTESTKDEVKEERLHRQLSNASKSSETKRQVEDDNTSYHSDNSFGEKHKKSKKNLRHRSCEGETEESPQSLHRFSKSSTKSEECKDKEKRKKSESSEREDKKLSRHHSQESSRRPSQSERQKSRNSRSRSRESEDPQASGDQYLGSRKLSRSKSKEWSGMHGERSGSKTKHHRSKSSSVNRISKHRSESRSTSTDEQTKEEQPRDQERSRSRSVEKPKKLKRDSERSRKKSQDGASRDNKDKSRSELNKEANHESSSTEHDPCSTSPSLQKHTERTPSRESYEQDKTSEATDRGQKTLSRRRASKEESSISMESKQVTRKRAWSRSTSRERSPKKRPLASMEVLADNSTDLNEDSTNISTKAPSFVTTVNEKQESVAMETNQTFDDIDSLKNKNKKAEAKDEEHVNRELKDENSGNVITKEASEDVRKQIEANDTLESAQSSYYRNTSDGKGISKDTSKETKTIGDELDSATKEEVDFSAFSDNKPGIEKASVDPGNEHHAKAKDSKNKTVESDQTMDTISGRIRHNTSVIKNEPLNKNSNENTNIQFGIPSPPPPPHILVKQDQIVKTNPPRGPPHNLILQAVVNPYARTYPDPKMIMDCAPIHHQPHNVPQCPVPQNISGPQLQSANQKNESNAFTGNVVPQGFTLGPNQKHLKDITSAPMPLIQQSSLLGLPTSASVIPFLGEEGPKMSEKKEEHTKNGAKNDASESKHAHASVSSPVDMDLSSPEEEDIIEKMNEEFWENERKGSKKDDSSIPEKKSRASQYDSSSQKVRDGEEDYDPEHFVTTISPKRIKKKDKTKKHSDVKHKTKVQSLLDKLHRQARVEEEVKIVLKDYYKHREINKNEYKDILRKAVPQVANSDHSIDPERIRSLVKKYVAKVKGHRLLKPNS